MIRRYTIMILLSTIPCAPLAGQSEDDHQPFRIIGGKHVTIVTDLRELSDEETDGGSDRPSEAVVSESDAIGVEEFPQAFDQAAGQWCEYFGVDRQKLDGWKMTAYVMLDDKMFKQNGMLPDDLPAFPAGFERGDDIWVYVKPGQYYTRHLLLHEGTHAFMRRFLGGTGPPWYAEGMAELLGLHRWTDQQLTLPFRMTSRDEAPYWGRVKLIKEDLSRGIRLSIEEVMAIEMISFRDVRSYAWSWAACEFLSNHPETRQAFLKLKKLVINEDDFWQHVKNAVRPHRPLIEHQWQTFIDEMDYGYDVAAMAVFRAAAGDTTGVISIDSRRGWQETGTSVVPGKTYRISATGQFQIADYGQPWISEPTGVTIQYYRGRPLGQLIAAVYDEKAAENGFLKSISIGRQGEFKFETAGDLYLRANDNPARLHDNRGSISVRVEEVTP